MSSHKVYGSIIEAIKQGRLKEPFINDDFRNTCLGLPQLDWTITQEDALDILSLISFYTGEWTRQFFMRY